MLEDKILIGKMPEKFEQVLRFISEARGVDLCSYRPRFTYRHLRSRMIETKSADCGEYINYLKDNPEEIDNFLGELSINVTHFFRDAEVFKEFQSGALAALIDYKRKNKLNLIRLWSAGCASGQEPYSLAIMMKESLSGNDEFTVKVWATDVDAKTLERARAGEYDAKDLRETDKKILDKYFQPSYNGKYLVADEIKEMVRFEKRNLISEPGLKFIDIIFCRNVMIYFTRDQQEALFNKFHQSLNSGGYLVIAKVESIWNKELFTCLDARNKIYKKTN